MNSSLNHTSLLIDDHFPIAAFDFDGNILSPETPIYLIEIESRNEVAISGHELDQHPEYISGKNPRYRWHEDITQSLIHFRDFHSDFRHVWPDVLRIDIEKAIASGALSPSLNDLKTKFLISARPFAIITARGHSPDNLTRAIWIINEALLSEAEKVAQYENIQRLYSQFYPESEALTRDQALRYYFEKIVSCYPVSNPHIAKFLDMEDETSMSKRKSIAMAHYIKKCVDRIIVPQKYDDAPRAYGFSDDSVWNIRALIYFFEEQRRNATIRTNDKIRIYFTGKKDDYPLLIALGFEYEIREDMLVLKL